MKPTTAQTWAAHSLEAIAIGAAVNAAINAYTAYQSSNLTLSGAAVILVSVFLSICSKGVAGMLSNPQTIQAASDSFKQLQDATTALITSHQDLLATVNTLVQQQSTAPQVLVSTSDPANVPTVTNMAARPVATGNVSSLGLTDVMKVVGPQQ